MHICCILMTQTPGIRPSCLWGHDPWAGNGLIYILAPTDLLFREIPAPAFIPAQRPLIWNKIPGQRQQFSHCWIIFLKKLIGSITLFHFKSHFLFQLGWLGLIKVYFHTELPVLPHLTSPSAVAFSLHEFEREGGLDGKARWGTWDHQMGVHWWKSSPIPNSP